MWRFFIELFTERCYGDFVESAEVPGDGIPVCYDPVVAKDFESVVELEEWVEQYTSLEKGEHGIKGIYYHDYIDKGKH